MLGPFYSFAHSTFNVILKKYYQVNLNEHDHLPMTSKYPHTDPRDRYPMDFLFEMPAEQPTLTSQLHRYICKKLLL